MFCKWYNVNSSDGLVKVQGLGEKEIAEKLSEASISWVRPERIKTPFGYYTPDFKCSGIFLEVKGTRTLMMLLGKASMLDSAKEDWARDINDISYKKMVWLLEETKKPFIIYINDSDNDSKYFKNFPLVEIKKNLKGFEIFYGKSEIQKCLDFIKNYNINK